MNPQITHKYFLYSFIKVSLLNLEIDNLPYFAHK